MRETKPKLNPKIANNEGIRPLMAISNKNAVGKHLICISLDELKTECASSNLLISAIFDKLANFTCFRVLEDKDKSS